jgi:phage repressor protein C with HTH and peptisase S24 domain
MEMREILAKEMEKHGDDAYSLAEKSGVPQPTTQRFLSGVHKSANAETVKKWAKAYGLTESQLRGDMPIGYEMQERSAYQNSLIYSDDVIKIPLLNAVASMGNGNQQQEVETVIDMLTISKTWADKTLRPYTNSENLAFIHAIGDSMHPTFNDGDILMIDTGDKSITADKIYVLEAYERLFIKRVRQRLDGEIEISSDNPSVKTVDILNGNHTINVLGRVVWVWNGRKV